jgi:hypothetical protein
MMTLGFDVFKPNKPNAAPPTKPATAKTDRAKMTSAAMTAPTPLLRAHWLRVSLQRSHRIVLSCSKFTLGLEPAQFLRFALAGADNAQEFVFQRSIAAQLFHRALVNELPVRDDSNVTTKFFDNLQHV